MCHLPAKQSRTFTVFCSDSKHSCDVGLGYKTLAGNIAKFRDHDSMHMHIELSQLDEGDGLHNTLVRCKARCHKSCYDLFNSTKLKQAKKKNTRLKVNNRLVESIVHMFSFTCISQQYSDTCFFCMESILHVRTIFTMSQCLV